MKNNYQTSLHGSAISNANVLTGVIKGKVDKLKYELHNSAIIDGNIPEYRTPIVSKREPIDKPHCSRYDNISNAKQHSSHACQTTIDRTSTNEGRNEEMREIISPAL